MTFENSAIAFENTTVAFVNAAVAFENAAVAFDGPQKHLLKRSPCTNRRPCRKCLVYDIVIIAGTDMTLLFFGVTQSQRNPQTPLPLNSAAHFIFYMGLNYKFICNVYS